MARTNTKRSNRAAFLNIPYDSKHERLYLAYIAGLCGFGLIPHATIELPSSDRRLDRIMSLITSCGYSFHDLSRVELHRHAPRTPRFNMPFELGLAVAISGGVRHQWFVFESLQHRLKKSLSDMDGTDPHIHQGEALGVLRALSNALSRESMRPALDELEAIYRDLRKSANQVKDAMGSGSIFEAVAFRELVTIAQRLAKIRLSALRV